MNIYLLIEALSESEKQELKDYFLKKEKAAESERVENKIKLILLEDFINMAVEMRPRLIRVLRDHRPYLGAGLFSTDYTFPYANFINKKEFMRIKNGGIVSWEECKRLMEKYNVEPIPRDYIKNKPLFAFQ